MICETHPNLNRNLIFNLLKRINKTKLDFDPGNLTGGCIIYTKSHKPGHIHLSNTEITKIKINLFSMKPGPKRVNMRTWNEGGREE